MITLTVISLNGAPAGSALSAHFDELGGTIGRADTNQLVLPDPDRAISRVHAQVVYRGGAYAIVDRGSNPILVNGQPVGSGREVPIKDGDRVQVGGFVLEVRRRAAADASAGDDPFADLLGPAAVARAPAGAPGGAGLFDPLSNFDDPRRAGTAAPPAAAAEPGGGIPDDWDPFAPDPTPARAPAEDFARSLGRPGAAGQFGLDSGAAAPAALVPGLPSHGPGNDNSLDALFGLKAGGGGDPLANSRLDAPMSAPNMAASHDPLKSLASASLATAETAQDGTSDLQRPYAPPPAADRAMSPASAPVASPPAPSRAPAATAIPTGAVMSWDAQEAEGRTVIHPAARAPAPVAPSPAAPASVEQPDPMSGFGPAPSASDPPASFDAAAAAVPAAAAPAAAAVAAAPPASPAPVPVTGTTPAPVPPPASAAHADALLAAFRDGLQMPDLKLDQLTPDLMRLVGRLLHESARGTVDLLVARAALKREVRAEATMIVAQKNNPLKFSPSAEAALQHLLSPPMRGFMEPVPAMRDAYDDLRAHQFGFIAGMRAALAGVLDRFKPSELEGRLAQRSGLRALLPGSRKAAMWDVFTEHYAQLSNEAEEDFHSLFGKAFLKAYEEHIAQLQKDASR